MVFNMRSSARSPPLVATCGAACGAVGGARGQNFHSIDYKLLGGKHLVFISAQIDNNMGAVEIVDEAIIALLTPARQAPGFVKNDDHSVMHALQLPAVQQSLEVRTDCGAVADGTTDNSAAITTCFRRLKSSGGGQLTFPAGTWATTSLVLEDVRNIRVLLDPDAVLTPLGNASTWPLWGAPCTYRPFIHIVGGSNVTLEGGVIDGKGRPWWDMYYSNRTFGTTCDRPFLLYVSDVSGFTARHQTLLNPPCEVVILDNVSKGEVWDVNVTAKFYATSPDLCVGGYNAKLGGCEPPNVDGINAAGGSQDIWIHDLYIESGDDAVVMKQSKPGQACTRNVLVENVYMINNYGAAVGSISEGCVENVLYRNLSMTNVGCGCWIKATNGTDPNSYVRNVTFEDIEIVGTRQATSCGAVSVSQLYYEVDVQYVGPYIMQHSM